MNHFRYLIHLAYEGTCYCGWQIQPNGLSIQQLIEEVLETLFSKKIRLFGAGRTDAGVHATRQSAHFTLERREEPSRILRALNGQLPSDIRLLSCLPVPETFHAQFSAIQKEYHYHIWQDRFVDPFSRHYRYHFPYPLSLPLLEKGAKFMTGRHDFTSFTNRGSSVKSTVRTIHRIECIPQEGGFRLEFEGEGFLYKMVRNLVGTLLEVGRGKRALEDIPSLLEAKDRRCTGMAAPAKGLFLHRVDYPSHFFVREEKEEETVTPLLVKEAASSLEMSSESSTDLAPDPIRALSPLGESSNPIT
ncbi:MAG: tRNA pseudouridine synthase A [Chlamydiae bacterium]|nr:tRNA pseudouridine synthase A [Chlamydiota bacterium]